MTTSPLANHWHLLVVRWLMGARSQLAKVTLGHTTLLFLGILSILLDSTVQTISTPNSELEPTEQSITKSLQCCILYPPVQSPPSHFQI